MQCYLIGFNNGYGSVPQFVVAIVIARWQRNESLSFESEKNLPASHVLQSSIGLAPGPFLTKDFGNMSSALVPMPDDCGLNRRNIFFVNGPFSDGNGQHVNRISERTSGRQQKMHGPQKKVAAGDFARELVWIFGLK